MIIGITGYGYSGASACIALLKEFESIQFYQDNFEFQLIQQPDGIEDLYYNLVDSRRRISINSSICRFKKVTKKNNRIFKKMTGNKYADISAEYLSNIISVSWKGRSYYDPSDIQNPLEKGVFRLASALPRKLLRCLNREWTFPPRNRRFFSCLSREQFIENTSFYLKKLLEASGFNLDGHILLEQLFSTENPSFGHLFFKMPCKTIIVDRDPRDIFLLTSKQYKGMCEFMPHDGNVKDFIAYYKGLHGEKINDPNVLYLRYEDLIFDYKNTISLLEAFLGLKHVEDKTFFVPEKSVNNTEIFKKIKGFEKEVKEIEKELADYLYPFESVGHDLLPSLDKNSIFNERPGDIK